MTDDLPRTRERDELRAKLTAAGYETALGKESGLIFVRADASRDPPTLPPGWQLVPTAGKSLWFVALPPKKNA